MSVRKKAWIAGAYEHPGRELPGRSLAQIHAEVAEGALSDAGLGFDDVDAYYSAGDAPGFGALSMVDYLGLQCRNVDNTETGGSSYLVHVQHAAEAIAAGHIQVGLITLAGNPRTGGAAPGGSASFSSAPEAGFETLFGMGVPAGYALAQSGVLLHYVRLSLWPHRLCLDYLWPPVDSVAAALPPLPRGERPTRSRRSIPPGPVFSRVQNR